LRVAEIFSGFFGKGFLARNFFLCYLLEIRRTAGAKNTKILFLFFLLLPLQSALFEGKDVKVCVFGFLGTLLSSENSFQPGKS
jgi:hypothetical protein